VDRLVLRIARTHAAHRGVTYAQALDEALCFGWIDGVRRSLDGDSFSIRFTPRRSRSIWSNVNVRHVERLIETKRMTKGGLAAFAAREESRTGIYSFEKQPVELDPVYAKSFRANQRGWAYFKAEAPWYRRLCSFWVMSAKRPATRLKRLTTLIDCSGRGVRIGPVQRSPGDAGSGAPAKPRSTARKR
jgi:uncharacterized protein YdeI (YjbR/CyaY-like superfamily)